MTDNLAEAVERLLFDDPADISPVDWANGQAALRTILSSLKGDEEMVERLAKAFEPLVDQIPLVDASQSQIRKIRAQTLARAAISVIGEGR